MSDEAIDLRIREILKEDARFHGAGVVVSAINGEVSLKGRFLDFRDPFALKNRVAEIKGVVDTKISAVFQRPPNASAWKSSTIFRSWWPASSLRTGGGVIVCDLSFREAQER